MKLITNQKLEAAFKKVVAKDDARTALQCLHFDKDGSVVATDSHVLLRIEEFHNLKQNLNLNLKTFLENDLDHYPETKRLIPQSFSFQLRISSDDLADALPAITSMAKARDKQVTASLGWDVDARKLTVTSGLVTLNIPAVISYGLTPKGETHPTLAAVNPKYLAQAIEFYTQVTEVPEVSFGFNGALRPIAITYQTATYLVTPVRTY